MRLLKIMLIALILCAVSVLSPSCASDSAPKPEGQVVTVQRGNLRIDITAAGNLALSLKKDLAFEMAGYVEEVLVEEGESVEEGQLLAKLDTSEWDDQVTALERQVTAKERQVTQANRQVTAKERGLLQAQIDKRDAKLALEAAENECDDAETALDDAKERLHDAKQKVSDAETALDDAKQKVSDAETALDDAKLALKTAEDESADEDEIKAKEQQVELANGHLEDAEAALENAKQGVSDAETAEEDAKQKVSDAETAEEKSCDEDEIEGKEQQVELARGRLDDAETALEDAKQGVGDAETALGDAQKALDEARATSPEVTAPFTGFITNVNVSGGDEVKKGTVAVTLAAPAKFEADILVSEMDMPQVKLDGEATVGVDAITGLNLPAKVTHISPSATIQSGVVNYSVTVQIQSLEQEAQARQPRGQQQQMPTTVQLREGMTVTVSIVTNERDNVLLVPNAAVTTQSGQAYVQVASPAGTIEKRAIQAGIANWQYTEVTSGLSEGEKVAVPQGATTTSTTPQRQGQGGGMFIPGMGR